MSKRKRKLSKAEAGRIGGRMTARRHGIEHYRAAGKKGFMATVARHWQGDAAGYVRWLRAHGWLQDLQRASRPAARRASRSRPSPASTTRRTCRQGGRAPQRAKRPRRSRGRGQEASAPTPGTAEEQPPGRPRARRDLRAPGHVRQWTSTRWSHRPGDWTAEQIDDRRPVPRRDSCRRRRHAPARTRSGGRDGGGYEHSSASSKSTPAARPRGRGSISSPWASCWTAPPWASRCCARLRAAGEIPGPEALALERDLIAALREVRSVRTRSRRRMSRATAPEGDDHR